MLQLDKYMLRARYELLLRHISWNALVKIIYVLIFCISNILFDIFFYIISYIFYCVLKCVLLIS